MYNPSDTEIGLVVVIQFGICILLLATIVNGVKGYETLVGLGGQITGVTMALGATVIILLRQQVEVGE